MKKPSKKIDLKANATVEIPLPNNDAKERYSLFACIQHLGTYTSGHYVCHIKTQNHKFKQMICLLLWRN